MAAAGADPLNHRRTTTRWAAEILSAQPAVIAAAGRLRLPLLLLYADDDPIADPRAAEELFERAASADKEKRCYAGYYHEIFNEVGRAAVFDDLAAWLGRHVPTEPADGGSGRAAGVVGQSEGCLTTPSAVATPGGARAAAVASATETRNSRRPDQGERAEMHLFGDTSGPHMAHVHVSHDGGQVTLDWEVRNAPRLLWRVLRSDEGYGESAEPPGGNGQALVSEGAEMHVCDADCDDRVVYYTIFVQRKDGGWQRQIETRVRPHDLLRWFHHDVEHVVEAEADERHNPPALMRSSRPLRVGRGMGTLQPPEELDEWLRIEGA